MKIKQRFLLGINESVWFVKDQHEEKIWETLSILKSKLLVSGLQQQC